MVGRALVGLAGEPVELNSPWSTPPGRLRCREWTGDQGRLDDLELTTYVGG
ncbi:hypothetical protein [Kribbella lupini]|uniref:hypothetical protein n=1 Tax=Kribbella lupini TaxID=291602 RepID=UPI0031CFEFC7